MKKIIIRSVLLLGLIIMGDFIVGHALGYITETIKTGGQGRDNYICNECKDAILVFGSSRALHHYDVPILSDSLGMTGYNCGADGCGILSSYARLKMIRERHVPKIIILDLVTGYDVLKKGDNSQQLAWLKNRFDREGMAELFYDVDPSYKYKMLSSCYRYNSSFIKSLFVYLTGYTIEEENMMGYVPSHTKMRSPLRKIEKGAKDIQYDPIKLKYMDRFFQLAEKSHLYVVQSPIWYECDSAKSKEAQIIKDLCKRKGIPFINFTNNPKFMFVDSLFADGKHMNANGAAEFTKELAKIIKKRERELGNIQEE
ncbi:MAG: hypothetical protein J6Y23_11355 [Prevotella sp.]|nr:hypothetical protein [Prevotella sp.]